MHSCAEMEALSEKKGDEQLSAQVFPRENGICVCVFCLCGASD